MRSVFVLTSAFLGRISGETRCSFWVDEPVDHGFDPARLIDVDLGLTPSAAAAKEIPWEAVQVDDCFSGPGGAVSGSTLGPRWPEMRLVGAVYLAQDFASSLPAALRPPCPPAGMNAQPYECMTAVYWPHLPDPRAGNRYAGHHASIVAEQGSLAQVTVYPPGRSAQPGANTVTMWIDLASSAQCDGGPGSLTTIGVGDAPKHGALFLLSGHLTPPAAPE